MAASIPSVILQENAEILRTLDEETGPIGIDQEGRIFVAESKLSLPYLNYLFHKMPTPKATVLHESTRFYLERKIAEISADDPDNHEAVEALVNSLSVHLKLHGELTTELEEEIRSQNFLFLYAMYKREYQLIPKSEIITIVRGGAAAGGGGAAAGAAAIAIEKSRHSEVDAHNFIKRAYIISIMQQDERIPIEIREKMGLHRTNTKYGDSGSYWLKDFDGKVIGIFKPKEEEVGMPDNPKKITLPLDDDNEQCSGGIEIGTMWKREIAASRFCREFGIIPITEPFMIEISIGEMTRRLTGSLQQFVNEAENFDTLVTKIEKSPCDEGDIHTYHGLAVRDILIGSRDRHFGNMLFTQNKFYERQVIGIDNGLCFPRIFHKKEQLLPICNRGELGKMPLAQSVRKIFRTTDIRKEIKKLYESCDLSLQEKYGIEIRYEFLNQLIQVEPPLTAVQLTECFKDEEAPFNQFLGEAFENTHRYFLRWDSETISEEMWLSNLVGNFIAVLDSQLTDDFIEEQIRLPHLS